MTISLEATATAGARRMRVPDFFIVGNPKSGTTALYEMLKLHPGIYMPDLGTQFFAREQRRKPETLEQYLSLFQAARPEQRAGEMSRGYLRSHTAAGRIAELQPDAKIIAILREPASFLRSLHLELLQDHVETEPDLRKAIALQESRESGAGQRPSFEQGLLYSPERVAYVEQLRRYHAVFPRERVLVLIYDDFRRDNEGLVRRVLRFLEVDDGHPIEVTDANPTVRVRSPRMHEMVRSLYLGQGPVGRGAKTAIKAITPRRLRREGLGALRRGVIYAEPEPVDEELMVELRRRSESEVVALSEYLGRDLVTLWGYDRIG
jgi:Sulfotransferase domain